jgi:hypothetical protein
VSKKQSFRKRATFNNRGQDKAKIEHKQGQETTGTTAVGGKEQSRHPFFVQLVFFFFFCVFFVFSLLAREGLELCRLLNLN